MPRRERLIPSRFYLRWCDDHDTVEVWFKSGWWPIKPAHIVARRLFAHRFVIRQEVAALRARLGGEG